VPPTLTFRVPWSALCSDNRKFINRMFILSKEYRASKEQIAALSMTAAKKAKWQRPVGPVAVEIVVREPDKRRRDFNWTKCFKDGITQGEAVWWDDSQVRWELWRFSEPANRDTAGAEITVTVMQDFDDDPRWDKNVEAAAAAAKPRKKKKTTTPSASDDPVVA